MTCTFRSLVLAGFFAASSIATVNAAGLVSSDQFDSMFFFEVEGGLALNAGTATEVYGTLGGAVRPNNGGRAGIRIGADIGNGFDIVAGAAGAGFPTGTATFPLGADTLTTTSKGYYLTGDLEVGYAAIADDEMSLRVFGGLRALRYHHSFGIATSTTTGLMVVDTTGIGPRVGIEGTHQLGDSGLSLFGGASLAYLFGRLDESGSFSTAVAPPNQSIGRNIINIDARVGVSMAITDSMDLGVGYRASYFGGADLAAYTSAAAGPGTGSGSPLFHGPFVTLSGRL